MGNHNGTVRCGVCYQRGHNKRSCPAYTDRLLKTFERHRVEMEACQEKNEDGSYYRRRMEHLAEEIGKRTGTNPLTKQKITKRGPTRKCSYCKHKHGSWEDNGLGHTRRTCKELKADMAAMVEANKAYRAGILENLRANQIGVGSLLSVRMSGYFRDENGDEKWQRRMCTSIVRKIKWDQIACVNLHADVIVSQRMDKMGDNAGYFTNEMPMHWVNDGEGEYRRRWDLGKAQAGEEAWGRSGTRIGRWDPAPEDRDQYTHAERLAGVPAETINPPAGWENGESEAIKEYFRGLKK